MNSTAPNIFSDVPDMEDQEIFTDLLAHPKCRIERIISYGQASPDGLWYDQNWDEWILLISGNAELDVAGEKISLTPGSHLLIPAGTKHRVTKTSKLEPTIWLAIHLSN